jgi:AraC-like DNA-binding protein
MQRCTTTRSVAFEKFVAPKRIFLACGLSEELEIVLREATPDDTIVEMLPTVAALLDRVVVDPSAIDLVLIGRRDALGSSPSSLIAKLARIDLDLPLVAVCAFGLGATPEFRALSEAGAHEVLLLGRDDNPAALRFTIKSAQSQTAAAAVLRALRGQIPKRLAGFMQICLGPAGNESLEYLSRMICVHRATLFRHCRHEGYPDPKELRNWCRLLLAAFVFARSTRTIQALSDELGFASGNAFRNMVRSYLGISGTDFRTVGLPAVAEAFLRVRTAPESDVPERPMLRTASGDRR